MTQCIKPFIFLLLLLLLLFAIPYHILQNLPASVSFPCEVAKSNRIKNRYGNIVTCKYHALLAIIDHDLSKYL